MNIQQHLLVLVTEECAEIAKRATKMIRFGVDEAYKENDLNYNRLLYEFNDLLAVMLMLKKEGIFKENKTIINQDSILLKIKKIEKYMELSKERGLLD